MKPDKPRKKARYATRCKHINHSKAVSYNRLHNKRVYEQEKVTHQSNVAHAVGFDELTRFIGRLSLRSMRLLASISRAQEEANAAFLVGERNLERIIARDTSQWQTTNESVARPGRRMQCHENIGCEG